ncbi:G-protein coupled receptor 183-B [Electrophorus electricus]|uniref:G-protein coupled receptors family 1 profile domain-containing protein n=1 Tax=Electrophorus electricus TaxID=8005 RepID=A0AAY5EE35_ELEEL|nr:G-protein coupled receptor 183-B [Electrophorus electricus]
MSALTGTNCTDLYDHRGTARVLLPLAYAVICPLGLLGNALALHTIRLHPSKLNSTTVYSANLAASDLLFCLALPLRALYYALGFHWPMGEGLCKATALLFYLNSYAGVNFMTCLAVDRLAAVVLRPHWGGLRKPRTVGTVCLLVWLLVLVQTVPLLCMPLTRAEPDGTVTCMEYPNFEGAVPGLPYMLIGAVLVGYGLPLLAILACYSALSRKLQRSARANRLTERSGRARRAQRMVAGVVLVFVVCFSPYHLDLLQYMVRKLIYEPGCEDLRAFQVSLHVTVCLMNLNACLDPFVYFFACKGYKRRLLQLLRTEVGASFSSVGRPSPDSSTVHDRPPHHCRGAMPLDAVEDGR